MLVNISVKNRHIHETPVNPRLFCFDELMIGERPNCYCLLNQSIKQHSSGFGRPSVESKGELIQVISQLFAGHPALVDAQQPAFEQCGDPMNSGKHHSCPLLALVVQDGRIMDIAEFRQSVIPPSAIRYDCAAWSNLLAHESNEVLARGMVSLLQPDSSHSFATDFGSNDDQRPPSLSMSASDATTDDGFIHFYRAGQQLASWPNHCSSQFMQDHPGCFITTQTQRPLQSQSADATLLIGHPPYRTKPYAQGKLGGLKNGPSCYGNVPSTTATLPQPTSHLPCLAMSALRASEPVWPAKAKEIVPTGFLRTKPLLELQKSLGIELSHKPIL